MPDNPSSHNHTSLQLLPSGPPVRDPLDHLNTIVRHPHRSPQPFSDIPPPQQRWQHGRAWRLSVCPHTGGQVGLGGFWSFFEINGGICPKSHNPGGWTPRPPFGVVPFWGVWVNWGDGTWFIFGCVVLCCVVLSSCHPSKGLKVLPPATTALTPSGFRVSA